MQPNPSIHYLRVMLVSKISCKKVSKLLYLEELLQPLTELHNACLQDNTASGAPHNNTNITGGPIKKLKA